MPILLLFYIGPQYNPTRKLEKYMITLTHKYFPTTHGPSFDTTDSSEYNNRWVNHHKEIRSFGFLETHVLQCDETYS